MLEKLDQFYENIINFFPKAIVEWLHITDDNAMYFQYIMFAILIVDSILDAIISRSIIEWNEVGKKDRILTNILKFIFMAMVIFDAYYTFGADVKEMLEQLIGVYIISVVLMLFISMVDFLEAISYCIDVIFFHKEVTIRKIFNDGDGYTPGIFMLTAFRLRRLIVVAILLVGMSVTYNNYYM